MGKIIGMLHYGLVTKGGKQIETIRLYTPHRFSFDEITPGQVFEVKRKFTRQDTLNMAALSGDFNPLHLDDEFARTRKFEEAVVHATSVGAMFSLMFGDGFFVEGVTARESVLLYFTKPIYHDRIFSYRLQVKRKRFPSVMFAPSIWIEEGTEPWITGRSFYVIVPRI